jgi:hypothetical protein
VPGAVVRLADLIANTAREGCRRPSHEIVITCGNPSTVASRPLCAVAERNADHRDEKTVYSPPEVQHLFVV